MRAVRRWGCATTSRRMNDIWSFDRAIGAMAWSVTILRSIASGGATMSETASALAVVAPQAGPATRLVALLQSGDLAAATIYHRNRE